MEVFQSNNVVIFGSDIVDLDDSGILKDHYKIRFIRKICTKREIQWFFENDYDFHLKLWKIWAIKESTYKAVSRILFEPVFRYKEYEVQDNFFITNYKDLNFNNVIYSTSEFILALVYFYSRMNIDKSINHDFLFISWIKRVMEITSDSNQYESYSKKIRKFFNNTFYKIFQEKTFIYRKYEPKHKVFLAPYFYFKKSFYPISLSHHGKFFLFTIAIKKESFLSIINSIVNKNHNQSIIEISPVHYLIYELY